MTTSATERVGRYQLLEPIGHGPSGMVSRAKVFGVAGFERQFAIKRFFGELTNGKLAQQLSSAARAYGGLEHPRIARMSEFGIAQGTTYTAVEFVGGLDALRLITEAKLGDQKLPAGGALALVSQAARAVGYAHGRGLTHLGLSPTNVLITPEGDVKITDFGILAATLPAKPVDVARLAKRIGYLAPEQLANEATSAATDVFALGVLAYEMLSGERAFKGDTAAQIAKAVLGNPPAEPTLPRPIVRVLQRCLARSPFERFPDARAFADALDAALRVAPVPGTRKDIGAQVKQIADRLTDLHSGELSGMLSFNVGNVGPVAKIAALGNAAPVSRDSQGEVATTEFIRPDTPVAGPAPLVGPASRPTRSPADPTSVPLPQPGAAPEESPNSTRPDLPKVPVPPHTVPGLAPPPIPVPPITSVPAIPSVPRPPARPSAAVSTPTIPRPLVGAVPPPKPGQGPTKPIAVQIDAGPPERPSESPVSPLKMMENAPTGSAPKVPLARIVPVKLDAKKQVFGALRPDTDAPGAARTDLVIETDPGELPDDPAPFESQPAAPLPPPPELIEDEPPPQESLSVEMQIVDPTNLLDELMSEPDDRPTTDLSPHAEPAPEWKSLDDLAQVPPPVPTPEPAVPPERQTLAGFTPSRSLAAQPPAIASTPMPRAPEMRPSDRGMETMDVRGLTKRRGTMRWVIASVLGVMVLAAAAYVVYDTFGRSTDAVATNHPADAAVATRADAGTGPGPRPDSAGSATAPITADGGVVATPADAAVAPADVKEEITDTLAITSKPSGARVYIDGADSGTTPIELPGTPDKHTIGVFLAGHELYTGTIEGHGKVDIPLPEVTPSGGWAGIKVIHCKDKERYYVFVDGKPTGMTCPTERIYTVVGPHTVEIYDLVSETRRKWDITIKEEQSKFSYRIRVD